MATSHGELMLCTVPIFPPSLSLPCLPFPAMVKTCPVSSLIYSDKEKHNLN